MIVKTLVENLSVSNKYIKKHGLSLYIETKENKILFDLGPDDTFLKNAETLGLNLEDIDTVIISHGHYDHGGGLEAFLEINTKAKVYINQNAFGDYFSIKETLEKVYIGLDKSLFLNERIIFVDDDVVINDNLYLFSHVKEEEFHLTSNKTLLKKTSGMYFKDDFIHEQSLIIKDGEKSVLIAGCAHTGITNILNRGKLIDKNIQCIIGGFHLVKYGDNTMEKEKTIRDIGNVLKNENIMIYTGHCTGVEPYNILKEILKEKISYIKAGSILEI